MRCFMSDNRYYEEFLQRPHIKVKYNTLLEIIRQIITNPNITYRPLYGRYEYWTYGIDKHNKVVCNNWVDGKSRSINRDIKKLGK